MLGAKGVFDEYPIRDAIDHLSAACDGTEYGRSSTIIRAVSRWGNDQ
jgi:hypothetical protein